MLGDNHLLLHLPHLSLGGRSSSSGRSRIHPINEFAFFIRSILVCAGQNVLRIIPWSLISNFKGRLAGHGALAPLLLQVFTIISISSISTIMIISISTFMIISSWIIFRCCQAHWPSLSPCLPRFPSSSCWRSTKVFSGAFSSSVSPNSQTSSLPWSPKYDSNCYGSTHTFWVLT